MHDLRLKLDTINPLKRIRLVIFFCVIKSN